MLSKKTFKKRSLPDNLRDHGGGVRIGREDEGAGHRGAGDAGRVPDADSVLHGAGQSVRTFQLYPVARSGGAAVYAVCRAICVTAKCGHAPPR